MKKAISNFSWTRALENFSVDEKVELLNEALLNIYRNYIRNRKTKCDYRQPPWINDLDMTCFIKCKNFRVFVGYSINILLTGCSSMHL